MLPFVYNLFKRTNILNNKRTSSPSRGTLYYQESKGKLIRIMPGFFVPESAELSDINMMQWIYAKQPDAVMNLISALSFHGLTTQIPAYLSLALPRGRVIPKTLPLQLRSGTPKKTGFFVEYSREVAIMAHILSPLLNALLLIVSDTGTR